MKSKHNIKRFHCPDEPLHGQYVKVVKKGHRFGLVIIEVLEGPTKGSQYTVHDSYLRPGLRLVG